MIGLKTLAENLQTKLNTTAHNLGADHLFFTIKADAKNFEKSLRIGNNVKEKINELLTLQSSDVSNLTDGSMFATMSCRLQVIFRLKGNENDEDTEIIDPDTHQVVDVIEGNYTKIERVRNILSAAFQTNTQEVMTDSASKNYLVCTLYQFIETGDRAQVQILGDSMSFTAYISYMFVENGVNTHDIEYRLDGNIIPFQTNTTYRTPTMDANVYADSTNGAVKNISSQSIFSVSFQLPALRNNVTRLMFDWLFGGDLNVVHILYIKYLTSAEDYTEKHYLVCFGENNESGETIKNIGQTMTLVECIDDYELINIPPNLFINERTGNTTDIVFMRPLSSAYNFNTRKFTTSSELGGLRLLTANKGDLVLVTKQFTSMSGWEQLNNNG